MGDMEETTASVHAIADGVVLLLVLVGAVAAAVAPWLVILVGVPTIVLHQVWTARRRRDA